MKIRDIIIESKTVKVEPQKPRNFVAKNAMATTSGAGAHRDKKKEQKQGYEKHKGQGVSEEAAGVGIVTKQNATVDVPVGGEYMNVKKLFPKKKKVKEGWGDVRFKVGNWEYRAEEDDEGDVRKMYHDAIGPDGKRYDIDFSPYSVMDKETFKMWIKTGMPKRETFGKRGPVEKEDIMKLAQAKGIATLDREMARAGMEDQVQEEPASRALCTSGKPDSALGASQLASCKSQGYRSRDGGKSHKVGSDRVKVRGKKIKGKKYGGPLPDWS
jgi:hypothetical protein